MDEKLRQWFNSLPCEVGQKEWEGLLQVLGQQQSAVPAETPTKRCSITGNPCGTDTWKVGNPPDCECGRKQASADTPETDGHEHRLMMRNDGLDTVLETVPAYFARRLERERNEARRDAERLKQDVHYWEERCEMFERAAIAQEPRTGGAPEA